jgi:exodeoxyribonuclease VII large subunit
VGVYTEKVARAVIACKTPSFRSRPRIGVFTICDFVADLRAPTPSALLNLCCPDIINLIEYKQVCKSTARFLINARLDDEYQRIDDIAENSVYRVLMHLFPITKIRLTTTSTISCKDYMKAALMTNALIFPLSQASLTR